MKTFISLMVLNITVVFTLADNNKPWELTHPNNPHSYRVDIPETDTVLTASVGNDLTNPDFGRALYASPSIYDIYGSFEKVENARKGTVFVDCTAKQDTPDSGVILNLNSLSEQEFPRKDEYLQTCDSRIVLSVAHVVTKHKSSGGCFVYHQDQDADFNEVNSVNLWVNPAYNDSKLVSEFHKDIAFLKLRDVIFKNRGGLNLCTTPDVRKLSCDIQSKNIGTVSQAYGYGVRKLVSSESCCLDFNKKSGERLLAHTCHTEDGASGGPILNMNASNGNICLAGIHVGASEEVRFNYGVPVSNPQFKHRLKEFLNAQCL